VAPTGFERGTASHGVLGTHPCPEPPTQKLIPVLLSLFNF